MKKKPKLKKLKLQDLKKLQAGRTTDCTNPEYLAKLNARGIRTEP